jgi:hypothetical protein
VGRRVLDVLHGDSSDARADGQSKGTAHFDLHLGAALVVDLLSAVIGLRSSATPDAA